MPSANNGLHQLLGLRLRFCLRGKYSDIFNSIFQINFVDLFWPVPAAATECKRANVVQHFRATRFFRRKKHIKFYFILDNGKKNYKSNDIFLRDVFYYFM